MPRAKEAKTARKRGDSMGQSNRYYCSPLCGGWKRTHRPIRHNIIYSLADLLEFFGADTAQSLNRRVYKDTVCGASISVLATDGKWYHTGRDWTGVTEIRRFTIQTIVEGSDVTVDSDEFVLPVRVKSVREWVEFMEAEANRLWEEANPE